ncbi:hypothetical protein MTR67_018727 [Solanum verrucosum]|uniref:Uncharacterized protein n=1 Tax=Solanum verrucosum TaxID=315347 RepID=A0AAF0TLT9_SOLVR|nr:hypothetical protein MTR67_018727 [Solanum verrucosum]
MSPDDARFELVYNENIQFLLNQTEVLVRAIKGQGGIKFGLKTVMVVGEIGNEIGVRKIVLCLLTTFQNLRNQMPIPKAFRTKICLTAS